MPERSPEGVAHLPQNRLLSMLLAHASTPGAPGRVRFGHAVAGVRQTPSGVVATLAPDARVWPAEHCKCPCSGAHSSLTASLECVRLPR